MRPLDGWTLGTMQFLGDTAEVVPRFCEPLCRKRLLADRND